MAYGIKMPPLAEWIFNLGEAAEYMFDHSIFQDNLVFVDFCEQMVKETNPSLLAKAEQHRRAARRHPRLPDDRRHHARRSTRSRARCTARRSQMSRLTREMFCLMEGRHVHPSTLYPGGIGTVATPQVFTDYLARLLQVPRLRQEGRAAERRRLRLLLRGAARLRGGRAAAHPARLLGLVPGPRRRRLQLRAHDQVGHGDVRHARHRRRRRARHHRPRRHQPRDPHPARQLATTTTGRTRRRSSTEDPLGNPVDKRHPWNQTTMPKPQKRDLERRQRTAG